MVDPMRTELVENALRNAAATTVIEPGAIWHSDCGSGGVFNRSLQHLVWGWYESPVSLEIRLVPGDESDESFVLINGSRVALTFLADVLTTLAEAPNLPAKKSFGPFTAGSYHVTPKSNIDIYLQCESELPDGSTCATACDDF